MSYTPWNVFAESSGLNTGVGALLGGLLGLAGGGVGAIAGAILGAAIGGGNEKSDNDAALRFNSS